MKRYRVVDSSMPSGAYRELSAPDDEAAMAAARAGLYGGRLVSVRSVSGGVVNVVGPELVHRVS